jgi:hypothetical protein
MRMAVLCLNVATLLENDVLGEWILLTSYVDKIDLFKCTGRYLASMDTTRLDMEVRGICRS